MLCCVTRVSVSVSFASTPDHPWAPRHPCQASRPSAFFFRVNMSDSISPAIWRAKVAEIVKAANVFRQLAPEGRPPYQVGAGSIH